MTAGRKGGANVVELFRRQAEAHPDAPAIIEGSSARRRVTTFAQLDARGARGAAQLRASGMEPGDAVLVLVPLSARLYEVLAAVFRAGLVAIILDPGAGRAHVEAACALRPPDAFIGSRKAHLLRLAIPGIRAIPRRFSTSWMPRAARWGKGDGPPLDPEPVGEAAPALLTFTSGTTGQPKAAIRTHGLLAAQHAALHDALALEPGQVDLATLPVVVLANLASGVTTVLPDTDLRRPAQFDTRRVLRQIHVERPTRSVASPAFFDRLLARTRDGDLDSFQRFDTGGAPVFPDLLDRLAEHADRAVAVYGSTEAEPIAHLAAADLSDADRQRVAEGGGLPVGPPVPQVDLRVVRDQWGTPRGPFSLDEWDAEQVATGEVGEIVVAGDHVVPGYLGGIGDADTKIDAAGRRWHRTGDAGRLDADGRLWLLGRCTGASRRDAHVVYPLQVEAALRESFGVRAAFVDLDGRRIVAVEGRGEHVGLVEAVAWAQIDEVVGIGQIPVDRRHNAKVDRGALIARLRGR